MYSVYFEIIKHILSLLLQFVPFRDYVDRSGNQVLSMARLAKDVLAEIPDQLLSFMKSRGIEPRPALSTSPLHQLHRHIWPWHSGHSSLPLHPDSLSPFLLIYTHLPCSYLSLIKEQMNRPVTCPLLSSPITGEAKQAHHSEAAGAHPWLSSLTHPVMYHYLIYYLLYERTLRLNHDWPSCLLTANVQLVTLDPPHQTFVCSKKVFTRPCPQPCWHFSHLAGVPGSAKP